MGNFFTNAVRHPEDTGVGNIRRTVNLADFSASDNLTNGVPIGTLEAGAIPLTVHVYVATAFNAGTTNTLDVGVPGTIGGYGPAASTLVGAAGYKTATGTLTGAPLAADTTIYAKFGQTGTAATTGTAIVILTFVNKREGTGIPFPNNP